MKDKIRAVIFDMDGVIFDTERLWQKAFTYANEKYGLGLTEEYRQSTCGKSEDLIRKDLREAFPDLDVATYRNDMLTFVKESVENGDFNVNDGFEKTINALKADGYKIALATSSRRERAKKMFRVKNLKEDEIFDAEVFGEEVGEKSKPDPYIFLLAAEKLDLRPDECCVVEDSINGIQGATAGGFLPIMAVDLIAPDEFCKKNAKIICKLSEILRVLEEV